MFAAILLIIVLAALFALLKLQSGFARVTFLLAFGITLLLLASILYSSKVTTQRFPGGIDYDVVMFFHNSRLPIPTTVLIYNFCLSFFMALSGVCFAMLIGMKPRFAVFLLGFPALLFLYLTPGTAYGVYLSENGGLPFGLWRQLLARYGGAAAECVFWLYAFAPFAEIVRQIASSKIFTRRKDLIVTGACLLLLNAFTLIAFRLGAFAHIWFNNVDVSKLPTRLQNADIFVTTPILIIGMCIIIILLLLYFRPFSVFTLVHKNTAFELKRMLNKNLSMQLHVYKNAFLSLGQCLNLIRLGSERDEREMVARNVTLGADIVREHVELLSNTLLMLKRAVGDAVTLEVDVAQCVRGAVEKTMNDGEIQLCGNYGESRAVIKGDAFHLTECFVNILMNARESMQKTARSPQIRIDMTIEGEYCMLEFIDNGAGIEKRDLRHVFEPFYSTKPCGRCGGIGLDYVRNVIVSHNGEVRALSVPGKYANIQCAFYCNALGRS
ncbi:MAG: HAMP domain-containing histidine kinase [Clostridiales bacterium]|jgi:signal transduction histidine kinase|nr:HAMP domain-containing histidine kinase [Clostridiales bacterium]